MNMARDLIEAKPTLCWPKNVEDVNNILQVVKKSLPPLPTQGQRVATWLHDNKRAIQIGLAIVGAGCAIVAGYRIYRARERAEEPDPFAPPTAIIEVAPDIAQGVPVSFCCPASLRSLVIERAMLLERTPALCQKIKSIAGRWCDENNVTPDKRPTYIAGAIAACMCVPELEQHLLLFETGHNVQELYKRVRRHQGSLTPEARKMRLLDWLTRPGRR